MKKLLQMKFTKGLFATSFLLGVPLAANASEAPPPGHEVSAIAAGGFAKQVKEAKAVIIRVPRNEEGLVNTSKAELRVYSGESISKPSDITTAWEQSVDMSNAPQINKKDIKKGDTSTWGWWGGWRGNGWYNPNCYYSYQPYFYYGGYGYGFSDPYMYSSYNSYSYSYSSYGAYNYYYYPRYYGYW